MRHPRHGVGRAFAVLAIALTTAATTSAAVGAQEGGDPALDQTIERDQAVVEGQTVLDDGHVDIGPRMVDGDLTLLVHDDSVVPAVWRSLDDTVMHVKDAAIQTVPDDDTYSFLGVAPGTPVHVIPQVQRAGVPWVGWNTQDPEVMETIDRGATLSLLGVDGPGDLVVYLQSGVLGDPEVLWSTPVDDAQPLWVEVNTHTHANWVFSEPGVYLVMVEISADLVSGQSIADTRTLRFAAGDGVDPVDALEKDYSGVVASGSSAGAGAHDASADPAGDGGSGGTSPALLGVGAAVAVLLGAVAWTAIGGRRVRARAESERRAGSGDTP